MPVGQMPFIGPSYQARAVNLDAQRCVNLYPEMDESGQGKTIASLNGTPGLRHLMFLPGVGGCRGLYGIPSSGRVFAIRGNTVSEIFFGWGAEVVGHLTGTRTGPLSMIDNGRQLCIVDEPNGYIIDLLATAPSVELITDVNFRGATTVTFQDGYFIFNEPDTGNFFLSALYDGLTYNPTDVAVAEGNPDNVVAVQSDHRELWVIGQVTSEIYYNSGNTDFPFERIQGAFLEWGTSSPYTVQRGDEALWFLAGNRTGGLVMMRIDNYQGRRISTHAVELALKQASLEDIALARGYITLQEGHTFYVLTIGEQTWVYDVATELWHERARWKEDGTFGRHRGEGAVVVQDIVLTGDFETGELYAMSMDAYDDAGRPLVRMRTAPYVGQNRQWVYHESLEIDFERGGGLDSGQEPGETPQAKLEWSNDDARTWSTPLWQTIGPLGQYTPRVKWNRLGRARDRVYRVTVSDPVKVSMTQAILRVR